MFTSETSELTQKISNFPLFLIQVSYRFTVIALFGTLNAANIIKYTGRFIMFSVITNIYNKKTKGPTLKELFTAIGKLKKFLPHTLQPVWQELEYRIDVCRVTRGAHIENL
jgi:hypothetical protein